VLIGGAGSIAVLGHDPRPETPARLAAGTEIDRVALGDRLPPPLDYAGYVVTDVDFVSDRTGWAIGLRCRDDECDVATWPTADGGRTWGGRSEVATHVPRESFAAQDPAGGGARSLRMVDANEGFAFNPDLYVTHDGGRTWLRAEQPSKVATLQVLAGTAWVFERGCPADDDCDAVLRAGTVGTGFTLRDLPLPATRGAPAMVRRSDDRHGFLVTWDAPEGPRATLRRTIDGGATWTDGVNPCRDATGELLSAGPGRPLWLVCTTSADEAKRTSAKQAFQSADGGETWRRLPDPPAAGVVTDLVALSGTTAYLTTQVPAQLLVTNDGGQTWQQARGAARNGYGYANLDVADARHVWAMGDAGALWRTTDGATWQRFALPDGGPPATTPPPTHLGPAPTTPPAPAALLDYTGLSFPDVRHGWALGERCAGNTCRAVLRRTDDGGDTWHPAHAPGGTWAADKAGAANRVRGVTFADARNGWLYGNTFYATHDGGATWRRLAGGAASVLVRDGALWVVGNQTCADGACPVPVRHGSVGSDTFTSSEPLAVAALAAADATHAYVVDSRTTQSSNDPAPRVRATADGGRTWASYPAPCPDALMRTIAVAGGDLWAFCGYEGGGGNQPHRVAHSTDGGAHWNERPSTDGMGYVDKLVALSAAVAWRGDSGIAASIKVTGDGGRSWRIAPAPGDVQGSGGTYVLEVLDATHGFALCTGNVFVRMTDGRTWHAITTP
jgi:photosystem II stability/assembly factor-like uncharacterized protein